MWCNALASVACVASAACAPGDRFVATGGAASLILAAVEPGAVAQLEAVRLTPETVIFRPESSDRRAELYAILYEETLEALALDEGPLTLGSPGRTLSAIATPARVHQLIIDGAPPGDWTELAALPSALADLDIALPAPCVRFEDTTRRLEAAASEVTAVAELLDSRSVLLGFGGNHLYRSDRSGDVPLPDLLPGATITDSFRDPNDGTLWLLGQDGRLWHGHPDRGGFTQAPATIPLAPGFGDPVAIDGRYGAGPFELFVATSSHAVFWFHQGQWELARPPSGPIVMGSRTRIAWAGEGEAVLLGISTEHLVEIRGGQAETVRFALPRQATPDGLFEVRYVEGYGPLVGTRYNVLLERPSRIWRTLTALPAPSTPKVYLITRIDDGILSGGDSATLTQYFPGYGYCEAMYLGVQNITEVLPVEGGLLAIGGGSSLGTDIIFLERLP